MLLLFENVVGTPLAELLLIDTENDFGAGADEVFDTTDRSGNFLGCEDAACANFDANGLFGLDSGLENIADAELERCRDDVAEVDRCT